MIARRLLAVAGVVAATALLTACPSPPNPNPGPSTSSPSPAPTSTSNPTALDPDVAFVVTGTLVSADTTSTVAFTMTVTAPSQTDAVADAAAFAASAHCPPDALVETGPAIADPAYLHVTIETEASGAAANDEVGVMQGYPLFATTWAGDFRTAQAYCSPPILAPIPGTATAIAILENGVDTGPGGWIPATGGYGVFAGRTDASGAWAPHTVDACAIEFGPASAGTPAVTFVQVDATTGCAFGLLNTP